MIDILFVLGITIICAFLAVTNKNIVYGVLFLLFTNISLGITYFMLGAPIVALFQLAVFAGAIVVFFVITIMFTKAGIMEIEEDAEK
ncbi:MAG: NADH-quinone oxidoreductase subunit J family protein [Promethearchaeota archaeon]